MKTMIKIELLKAWNFANPAESYYEVLSGEYEVIAKEDVSEGWHQKTKVTLSIELGSRILTSETDKKGKTKIIKWKVTENGLSKVK